MKSRSRTGTRYRISPDRKSRNASWTTSSRSCAPAPAVAADERAEALRRNLREYARTFDEADVAEETSVSAELVA